MCGKNTTWCISILIFPLSKHKPLATAQFPYLIMLHYLFLARTPELIQSGITKDGLMLLFQLGRSRSEEGSCRRHDQRYTRPSLTKVVIGNLLVIGCCSCFCIMDNIKVRKSDQRHFHSVA